VTPTLVVTDIDFLVSENQKKPVTPPPYLVSAYVEGHRVMPTNTPFPGLWENSRTPYLVELMDNCSPFSPIITTSVMKGAQIGVTAAAECIMGYWMEACPSEILYVSATDDLLEKWATKRLEPLIDSIGMRSKIFAQVDNAKSRRSGDKVFSKSYVGGNLDMASAQSAAGLRSDSKRILVLDEVDGAPRMLRTGEGNWLDVAYARGNAWGARKKIFEFSTPTTVEDSLINERYEAGDRRVFMVPCPHQGCGVFDNLKFEHLRHEMQGGQLHRVWYQCPHCDGEIHNYNKTWMFSQGYWEPTAIAANKGHRSYWIPSIYSPVGMLSWFDLYQKYLDAQRTPGGMRSFVNLYLGKPFKEMGSRPKVEKVIELRGDHREGEVPDGVLFITVGIDVQQGSVNDPQNPPRLELEVVGHGIGHRTWSILYKRIEGGIGSPFEGAWEKLDQWAVNGGLVFKRADGLQFPANMVFIDSGDGNYVDVVYGFAGRWQNTFPSKGFSVLNKRKAEKGDEAGPHNFKRYRAAKSERSLDVTFYEISTNYYKTHVYNNLKIERREIDPQKPGFCSFPRDRDERFFQMLTAEEKRTDGSFHAGSRRNEALDCRCMALCAADVFLDARVSAMRVAAKAKGVSDIELQQINHVWVLDLMARQTARRMVA
jgi:phage terminase large subunit GpA-like protein